jgi:hypothetical protein
MFEFILTVYHDSFTLINKKAPTKLVRAISEHFSGTKQSGSVLGKEAVCSNKYSISEIQTCENPVSLGSFQ